MSRVQGSKTGLKKIGLLIFLVTLAVGAGILALNLMKSQGEGGRFKSAPQFSLKDRSGKTVRLDDFQGKLVVLHFWASWCPPCVDEIPKWLELAKSMETNSMVKFVAVSLDKSWEDADKIMKPEIVTKGVVSLLDADQSVSEQFGSYQFPETYLISPDARVLTKWVGVREWNDPALKDELLKVIDHLKKPRK